MSEKFIFVLKDWLVPRAEDEEGEEGGGKQGMGGRIVRRKVTSAANPAYRLQDHCWPVLYYKVIHNYLYLIT